MDFTVPQRWSSVPVKLAVLAVLTLFIAILTVFSLANNIQVVFVHIYYVPIIAAAYWFDQKGVLYTELLSAFYVCVVHIFSPNDMQVLFAAFVRVIMLIGISLFIAVLSLRIRSQQDQIAQSEQRFRGVWESIQAGIILVDAESQTVIAANPEAQKMSGFTEEEMRGHLFQKFISPAEQGKYPISDRSMNGDRAEHLLLARDGKKVQVLKTMTDVHIGGKRFFIENFIDITPLKEAENTLIAYIREAALRIRNPVELVRDNLDEIRDEVAAQSANYDHISMALAIQQKNIDNILKNMQELDRAIAEKRTEIPDAFREYMKR
jgi:PAS domain S-box-containing protein